MSQQNSYQMSQGLEVLPPKADKAYPIPCSEWARMKEKIGKLSSEPWLFQNLGAMLLGASLSTFITILCGTFKSEAQANALVIAWAIVVVTLLSGVLSILFANKEKGVHRERASDLIAQMEIIEKRYENANPNP